MSQHRAWSIGLLVMFLGLAIGQFPSQVPAQELPFQVSTEVYRNAKDDVIAFRVRLEQPFLAGEFERSSYLRLRAANDQTYLIYPKETRFEQRHAEFFGRLRGEGEVPLELTYETISENLDGTRSIRERSGKIQVKIPPPPPDGEEQGPRSIYASWAAEQNAYFAHMLEYYPHESFFQYCLLQSEARYGVKPPKIPQLAVNQSALEIDLYEFMTPSLSIQAPLQRQLLQGSGRRSPQVRHVSTLSAPSVRSLPYQELLEAQLKKNVPLKLHDSAKLIPRDQYFAHFNSAASFGEALDLLTEWSTNIAQVFMIEARDYGLQDKLAQQLAISRAGLEKLAADQMLGDLTLTGADPFVLEGTDVTLVLHVLDKGAFRKEADAWLAEAGRARTDLQVQTFNYQGHQVVARYTNDRVISSFVVEHEDYVVYSNSHVAIRRLIDTAVSKAASLHDAPDYQYLSTLLPASDAANAGYFYASDSFVRRQTGPEAKISQKRRLECFNNLVMINNASLFFRLEYGRSPASLSELIEGHFVDMDKIHCPHGGSYAFEESSDACTCSLHNRLRYLTPNAELTVLNITGEEATEYERYKERYAAFWQQMFNPLAVRCTIDQRVTFETCVVPMANGDLYANLRRMVARDPVVLSTAQAAPSAIASVYLNPGRAATAQYLSTIPGLDQVIHEDPTLTDLNWLGDRVSLHYCDGDTILEIDPTQIRPLSLPFIGQATTIQQGIVGALAMSANMPVYATIDVTDREKAERLLQNFWQRIFLKDGQVVTLPAGLDAYQLPEYEGHAMYVLSARIYVATLRMHVALVGDRLVFATKPEILRQVIDQRNAADERPAANAHLLVQLRTSTLEKLKDDMALYWAEKSRLACHANIGSLYIFQQLYQVQPENVAGLSEAKYGIRHYCPEGGTYTYSRERNEVVCNVHGNREHSQQAPAPGASSYEQFIAHVKEMVTALRFEENALIATIELVRGE